MSRPPLDAEEQELVELLVHRTGCTRYRAERAIRTAVADGSYTGYLGCEILHWAHYLDTGRGANLVNPGFFVAAKLERAEDCPVRRLPPGTPYGEEDRRLEDRFRRRWARELAADEDAPGLVM